MRPENLLLIVLLGGLLLLMFSRTRKQQREAQRVQAELQVGAEVMTTAGLYATVVELEESSIVLETAPGQRSRWDRRAIARIIPPESSALPTGAAAGSETGEGAGARLAHDPDDGSDEGPSPSGPGTAPPDRA